VQYSVRRITDHTWNILISPRFMSPNQKNLLVYENEDFEKLASFQKKGYRTTPILFVNGERVPEAVAAKARPNQTLLSYLRDELLLTGSKLGCAEGGCGACTVMVSRIDKENGSIKYVQYLYPSSFILSRRFLILCRFICICSLFICCRHISVNACLMPVLAADGCHVTTVEGVGTVKGDNLHPVQKAMVDMHGSQCGFCTPGIIVSIYTLFANDATVAHIEEHLDGNLCRCTGYRPIWDAARSLCDDTDTVHGPCGVACRECPERDECKQDCNVADKEVEKTPDKMVCSSSADKMKQYNDTLLKDKKSWKQQPNLMFPKALQDVHSTVRAQLSKPLMVVDKSEFHAGGTWFKPNTLETLLALLEEYGGTGTGACKIVVGNTEVGIGALVFVGSHLSWLDMMHGELSYF